jgi:PAS domain S-box-containing protein
VALGPRGVTGAEQPRSVLLLDSRRSTSPAGVIAEQALRESLEQNLGGPIDLYVEYLDLRSGPAPSGGLHLTAHLAEKYAPRHVEVVVTQGAQALEFLLRRRERLFPGVPVVYTDVSREAVEALRPPADATGAFLGRGGLRTVDVALGLHPEAQRVVLVAGASPTDAENVGFARGLVEARTPGTEVESLFRLPLDELLERLGRLPKRSVVVFLSYAADASGRAPLPSDVVRRVARAASAPVYAAGGPWLGSGIVGGDLVQYDALARRAGGLAARILRGEPASSLPPIDEPSSALQFDARELARWGIDERRLPAGSTVLFREPRFWSLYRWEILGAAALVIGQGVLIGALLLSRRARGRDQARLREAEARYRTVADFTSDWESWARPDGSFAYVSPSCHAVTGYRPEQFEARPALLDEIVAEEDRMAWEAHLHARDETAGPMSLEFRIHTAGGETRWVEHVCRRVTGENGSNQGTRSSNRDITARKRSEAELRRAFDEIAALKDRLEADNTYLREEFIPERGIEGLIGASNALRYVVSKVRQVAPTSSTVHDLSPRRERPLVVLNCAALPPLLIESELFGHERGAFTGAHALRKGRFEVADGTTLFLDEIGELPLELQSKLLRAVQDGEFERVGGSATLRTDVRLVVATNRRLEEEVKAGRFREDLWYRLNVFPITVPPLRQRREDIPLLVHHFVARHCRKLGRPALELTRGVIRELQAREWPGNVRELESVVERAVISSRSSFLELGDEPDVPRPTAASPAAARATSSPAASASLPASREPAPPADGAGTLLQQERALILATLERVYWQVEGEGGAAALLGMNASTLRGRMRKHGIRRPGSRPLQPSP